jgi:hypothetical protein
MNSSELRCVQVRYRIRRTILSGFLAAVLAVSLVAQLSASEPKKVIVLNDDGAWCWFQDERVVIDSGILLVGSVANGTHDAARKGDIDVVTYDLTTGKIERHVLFDQLEADDHDAPALWIRPDGRLLAVFAKHGPENRFYYRLTRSADPTDWGDVQTFSPSPSSRVTYSNLHFLSAENEGRGRLYNFYRGLDASFKPSYAFSDDEGKTWSSGNVVIDVPLKFRHRPYVKYASDGRGMIHLLFTDGHPRNFDNSVYHVGYHDGMLRTSDRAPIRELTKGLRDPNEGTRIFRGDADNVGWVSDTHLSEDGHPYVVFSVQKNAAGLKSGAASAGQDHRYHYAWWDGRKWHDHEIAYGGTRLYAGEDDYTGNICLHPDHLDTVYISTDADPASGKPLISSADHRRHYEIFRGKTADGGTTWRWQPVTHNSTVDNLRPLVPKWNCDKTALLWFRGTYQTYRNYQTEIVVLIE